MSRTGLALTLVLMAAGAQAAPADAAFGIVGQIDLPNGVNSVAVSPSGDAIYADEDSGNGGGGIQRYTPDGTQAAQWTVPGRPFGLIVESGGTLLVADGAANSIYRFSSDGAELGSFGSEGTTDGKLHTPEDVAVGPNGDIYVTDNGNNRVERFGADGTYISKIDNAALPSPTDGYPKATFLSVDSAGAVYVTDGGNQNIRKFDASGALVGTFGTEGAGKLSFPGGTGIDKDGNLLVADYRNGRVVRFKPDGTFIEEIKGGLVYPVDVAADPSGNVYIADAGPSDIFKFAEDKAAPKLTLGGAAKQSIKSGKVKITATSDEAAHATASGPKLKSTAANLVAATAKTLSLKISAAAKRAVKQGKKVVVTVTVKATDASGNVATAKRKVTLRR